MPSPLTTVLPSGKTSIEMNNMNDIKMYAVNALAIGVTSLTNIEVSLKIILLVITIGYTLDRWVKLKKSQKDQTK
jgi:hypothetical protein